MTALDLSIDLDAIADLLDLSPFELEVWLIWLCASLGFGIAMAVLYQLTFGWRGSLVRQQDPYAEPFGDVVSVQPGKPWPRGASDVVVAERCLGEQGTGYSAQQLNRFRSPGVANPAAREGSGGVGKFASRGPAAACRFRLPSWSWGKRRAF